MSPRSTWRYSTFTLHCGENMYSQPAPAVQPVFVAPWLTPGADTLTSPKAAPPVTYHNELPAPGVQPRRPRTVPIQLFLSEQCMRTPGPQFTPPLMPAASITPSMPHTQVGLNCQL